MPPNLAIDVARSRRTPSRTRIWTIVGIVAGLAVAAGLLLREPVERALAEWYARTLTGADVRIDGVAHDGDALVLLGVHAVTPSVAVAVDAERVDVRRRDGVLALDVHGVRAAVVGDRWTGAESSALADGAQRLHLSNGRIDVSVTNGAATFAMSPDGGSLALDAVAGTVRIDRGRTTYVVSLAVDDGAATYPVTGKATLAGDGSVVHAWNAAALPLSRVLAPFAPEGFSIQRGLLRDLTLTSGSTLRATARLDGAGGTMSGRSDAHHTFAALSGPLVYVEDGLGTTGLQGTLDGVPVDVVGEVHDGHGGLAWLANGSNDLRRLERLAIDLSEEPSVRTIHLETTAPGLAYAQYAMTTDHGPLAVQVVSMDPDEPTLSFDTAIASDHVVSNGERTSAMGVRTNAVAGVNGDYFDIGRTYQPQGLLVRSGRLLRGPTDRAALVIDRSRHVTFGEFHLTGSLQTPHGTFPVTQLNDWPAGEVTVITPDFGATLPPAPGVTVAALAPLGGDRFRVLNVTPADSTLPVRFGVAYGPKSPAEVRPGETVRVSYHLDPPVRDAVAAIGGGPLMLRDGEWYDDPHAPAPDERDVRWPVIALGRQHDGGLLLVAVDGRHPERSVGMTRPEFGDLLKRLDVSDAMALDSGGSVTLVSRAPGDATVTVRNVPSDNSAERWVSDALFIYSSAPAPTLVPPKAAPLPVPEARPTP